MKHILKCQACGSYGLVGECSCGSKRVEPRPPKYTTEDKYAHYRRKAKKLAGKQGDDDAKEDT
jgi:rRNA maturation protein Nop10